VKQNGLRKYPNQKLSRLKQQEAIQSHQVQAMAKWTEMHYSQNTQQA